jgi:hypothetical protein
MSRLLVALLALLVLAPAAHADPRLVRAFDAASAIQSTGNGFAWTTTDGSVRVTDARGRTLYDVRPGERCETAGATRARVALIVCDGQGFRLDTETGTVTPQPLQGEPVGIGSWWIETRDDCDRCATRVFTNWRSGEQRFGGDDRRDLDDPSLGRYRAPYRLRGSTLLVRRGDDWREVARCRVACHDILVWRRRVAYLDGAHLIERRPRHTARWSVPRGGGLTLHRAVNALVLQRGARVWRAGR